MGINERRLRDREALRMKILKAAAEIIISEGFEKCTIRKVASTIEYSPRTVYLYFKDKDHLLHEIIEHGFKGTVKQGKEMKNTLDESNPRQFISEQIRNNIRNALKAPNLYRAIVYLLLFKSLKPGPYQQQVIDGIYNDLKICYRNLNMNPENLDEKVTLLFAFLRGFNITLINMQHTEEVSESIIQNGIDSMIEGILRLPKKE